MDIKKYFNKYNFDYFYNKFIVYLHDTFIHKTGDETISGTKIFTDTISGSIDGNAETATKLTDSKNINIQDADGVNSGTATAFDGSDDITIQLPSTIKANIDGDITGSSGSCIGNAETSSKLEIARDINISDADNTNTGEEISFDGDADITIKLPSTIKANITGDVSGNASSATEFNSNKSVTLTGDVTGTASSKAGWSVQTTLSNSGVTANTYGPSSDITFTQNGSFKVPSITVDSKGRVTNASDKTITLPVDDNVSVTLNTVSKAYLLGTTTTPTATAADVTTVADTGVYLGTTAGELVATKFTGTLNGTADKATKDASGNVITSTYAKLNSPEFTGTPTSVTPATSNNSTKIATTAYVKNVTSNIDASNITSGTISIDRLPAGIQLGGETSGELSTVPWSNVTDKPSTFTPSSHTHNASDINAGTLPIARGGTGAATLDAAGIVTKTTTDNISANAATATKVNNNLVIKLKSGSTEGTDLYTFNGSAGKTLDIKQGSNVTLTAASGSLTIAATDTTYSGATATANGLVTTGAQTWAGAKTFNGNITLNQSNLRMTVLDSTTDATARTSNVITGNSSNTEYGINIAFGSGGNAVVGGGESYSAQLNELAGNSGENLYLTADGNIYLKTNCNTFANAKTVTLNNSAELSGLSKVTATSFVGALTGNASTATKATQDSDGKAINSTYLKLAGGTLTGNLTIGKTSPYLCLKSTDIAKNTAPSSNYTSVALEHMDKNAKRLWGIYYNYNTDKTSYVRLIVNKGTTTDNTWTGIGVGYDSSGNWFTYAPTPATSSNTTHIATTAFVKAQGYLTSQTQLSVASSGSGNAVTNITVSNHKITFTKGSTFLTSHQSLSAYAKLASPTFTGTPKAPTAATSTNNTQIATTAFVKAQGYKTGYCSYCSYCQCGNSCSDD